MPRSCLSWRANSSTFADHVEGGADRAVGIVLVGHRGAEEGQHRIALQLGDRALVAEDGLRHQVERLVDDLRPVLGVHLLGERRRADYVGEEGRDRLALAGQLGGAHLLDERRGRALGDARLAFGVCRCRLRATQGEAAVHAESSVRGHWRLAARTGQTNGLDGHGQMLVR